MSDGHPVSAFRAYRVGDRVETQGEAEVLLGHRIDRPTPPHDGTFVAWHWDGAELVVHNDPYGAYPLFYAVDEDAVSVAPSIAALLDLGVSRELDEDALAAFLGTGFYLGDDSPFRAIRALPPAATLTWQPGRWSVISARPTFRVSPIARQGAIDGVIERFRVAISRRIPDEEDYVLPVSGGRDSRHILLELMRQGHPPRSCVTVDRYPHEMDRDGSYAARICAEVGIPHRMLERPGPLIAAERRKNELTSFCADEHAWFLPVADALDGNTGHTYDGLPGGTLLERKNVRRGRLRLLEAGRLDDLSHRLVRTEDDAPRYMPLLSQEAQARLSPERAAARIRRELEAHLDADEPLTSFFFWNRAMRELNLTGYSMLRDVPTVYSPFLDVDLVDFALSIPRSDVDYDLHSEILATAFPEVADVPFVPPGDGQPPRAFCRRVNRDLLRFLGEGDGSLVDRAALRRRSGLDALRGGDWLLRNRRAALATYLLQLEGIVTP